MTKLFVVLMMLCLQVTDVADQPLPDWTRAPHQPDMFVVETEPFPTQLAASEGILQSIRTQLLDWSVEKWGGGCRETIESMPLEDFRQLIFQDQEFIHRERVEYDTETARRLKTDHDDFYRGYARVKVSDDFCARVEPMLAQRRLRNRLSMTLIAAILLLGLLSVLWLRLFMGRMSRGLYVARLRWIAWGLVSMLLVICYIVYQLLF